LLGQQPLPLLPQRRLEIWRQWVGKQRAEKATLKLTKS
jgi:hypothetical protein